MPDSPTPPAPPTPSTPASGGQPPGDFNQGQLETIRKSEGLAHAAQKAEYSAILIADGLAAGTPAQLITQCELWRSLSGDAVGATTDKEQHSGLGDDAETALKRQIECFRGKARLAITQHPTWKDAEITAFRARYFINKSIFSSRALTEQTARDILANAAADSLPGVTPARLQQATAALAAYIATEAPQSDAQSTATQLRQKRDTTFAEALRLRHEIQYAADTAWPWWDDAHLAIRREFLLPAGRAFVG